MLAGKMRAKLDLVSLIEPPPVHACIRVGDLEPTVRPPAASLVRLQQVNVFEECGMMIVDDWTFEEMRVLGQAIAEDPETGEITLMELAMHYDPSVRKAVADHKNTPTDTLHMLAQDENVDLRYVLAENHNVPVSVLAILVDDENPFVATRAQKTLNRITVRPQINICRNTRWSQSA